MCKPILRTPFYNKMDAPVHILFIIIKVISNKRILLLDFNQGHHEVENIVTICTNTTLQYQYYDSKESEQTYTTQR